jgi:hypothetical protein
MINSQFAVIAIKKFLKEWLISGTQEMSKNVIVSTISLTILAVLLAVAVFAGSKLMTANTGHDVTSLQLSGDSTENFKRGQEIAKIISSYGLSDPRARRTMPSH